MAGDWIKMRHDLEDDPAVLRMASALALDTYAVVGRLHSIWSWADRHTTDGCVGGVSREWVDRRVHLDGFASAMESAGWLVVTDSGVEIPNFDTHNGESAKARALAARRKQRERNGVTQMSRSQRDKSVTREEKRREEERREEESTYVPDELKAERLERIRRALARWKTGSADGNIGNGEYGTAERLMVAIKDNPVHVNDAAVCPAEFAERGVASAIASGAAYGNSGMAWSYLAAMIERCRNESRWPDDPVQRSRPRPDSGLTSVGEW